MSHVNIFVIRTISCSSAASHLLTLLSAQININIPCFILTLLCFSALTNCTTKFPLSADNLNIHARPRGKDFKKNIFTSFFFFVCLFVVCRVVSVWHGLVKALTVSNNEKFLVLCYSEVCGADTTFPCELSHLNTDCCCDLVPFWCHRGAQNLKCLWNHEAISYKCLRSEGRRVTIDCTFENARNKSLSIIYLLKNVALLLLLKIYLECVSEVIWPLHDREEWRGCVSFVFAYRACGCECLCMPKYLSKSWNADTICCSILKAIHKPERLLLMFPCILIAKNIDIK